MVAISAVIIAKNEEANIGRCLKSLAGAADDILVVDSHSVDATVRISRAAGARVVQHEFEGHIQQKNYALEIARHDHVLSLDADEALSDPLKASILAIKNRWRADGYAFNRLTNYCGRWIRHGGWYPDRKIRLWNRNRGRWGGVNPHDRVIMASDATIGRLDGDLLHFSYSSIQQHRAKIDTFATIAAAEAHKAGRRSNRVLDMAVNPAFTFLKKYFLQLGLMDGAAGFSIAVYSAYGKFLKYSKLRELARRAPP